MRARDLARQELARIERPDAWLARKLGVSSVTVWRWMKGVTRPSAARREQIRLLLGVPVDAWDKAANDPTSDALPAAA